MTVATHENQVHAKMIVTIPSDRNCNHTCPFSGRTNCGAQALATDIHKIRTGRHDHERHSDEKEQILIHLIDTNAANAPRRNDRQGRAPARPFCLTKKELSPIAVHEQTRRSASRPTIQATTRSVRLNGKIACRRASAPALMSRAITRLRSIASTSA
jgi:hypothetical protein